jgi:N-acetyl-anhydromuramyl-L-alanine amidase AmpD
MNNIDSIIIHCSATKAGVDLKAKDIDRMHKQRGFNRIGYHYVINLDGTVETGRPLTMEGAHCNTKGFSGVSYNRHSIGICYIGGLDKNGKPADTRTEAQKKALKNLVVELCGKYEICEVLGHRDTSPDLDDDGEVEPIEWIKVCPCFDVNSEFPNFLKTLVVKP